MNTLQWANWIVLLLRVDRDRERSEWIVKREPSIENSESNMTDVPPWSIECGPNAMEAGGNTDGYR